MSKSTASTLSIAGAWNMLFAFVLNEDTVPPPARQQRRDRLSAMRCRTISQAWSRSPTSSCATTIRMRWAWAWRSSNTRRQAGADEIRGLWQWVDARLNSGVSVDEPLMISRLPASPNIVPAMYSMAPEEAVALTS